MKTLIISPHPDDETLGLGGSIKRFSELNAEVSVMIVSGHLPPLYKKEIFETTKKEAKNAFKLLGVNLSIPSLSYISLIFRINLVSSFNSFLTLLVFCPYVSNKF